MITLLLLYLLLLLFPFGQLTRLPLSYPAVNVYAHDIVLSLLVLAFILRKIFKKEKLFLPKTTSLIFIFISCCLLSLIFNFKNYPLKDLSIASLYLLRWSFYACLYFFVCDLLKRKSNLRASIIQILIVVGLTASLLGVLQYIFIPDIRPLTFLQWDPHYYRLVGTFLDPGFTGMIYVLVLILILVWCGDEIAKFKNLVFYAFWAIVYVSLVLTYARSAYLAYFTAMTVIAWFKKSFKFFLAVLILGAVTLLLLPRPGGEGVKLERKSTIFSRIESYKKGLKIALDHPVFGTGFNTLRYTQKNYGFLGEEWQETHSGAGVDSSLLFVFATTGIVGLTSYVYLLVRLAVLNFPSKKSEKLKLVSFTSLLSVFIHSFFNNSLFYPWLMIWLWVVLGLSELE